MITPNYLRECMDYDPQAGVLTWKIRPPFHFSDGTKAAEHQAAIWNAKYAGKEAFLGIGNHGYRTSSVGGKRFTGHRVAWAIHYGEWPEGEIDHINGNRCDNRIANLRDVSRRENAKNLATKSGRVRGVYWYPPTSRWAVKIQSDGVQRHIGYFINKNDAIAARQDAERRLGFHENHGRAY